jgi:transposase-like protein
MSVADAWEQARQAWRRLAANSERPRGDDDGLASLSDIGVVRRILDQAELAAVRTARRSGKSWAEIATHLGVTRQSAWERWRDLDDSPRGGESGRSAGSVVRLWLRGDGDAGVREPRRPRPTPRSARETLPEPHDQAVG